MDIFFQDPDEIPLPPEEVRILALRAKPWPDGIRVRIGLELTPFQKRPSAEIVITDAAGEEAASLSIIETMTRKLEMTVHLKGTPAGTYQARAILFYTEIEEPHGDEPPAPLERRVVDRAEIQFTVL